MNLIKMIASDYQNILKENDESLFKYTIKRYYYKISNIKFDTKYLKINWRVNDNELNKKRFQYFELVWYYSIILWNHIQIQITIRKLFNN